MPSPTGLALYASGIAPNGLTLVSDLDAGVYDANLHVTVACDYKNKNDEHKTAREIKVGSFPQLEDGTYYDERIFEGTGYLSSGVGVTQGTLIASSGEVAVLDVNPTGCSYQSGKTPPINLVVIENLEPSGGSHVRFGPFYDNYTDYVDGVLYTDYFMQFRLKPGGTFISPTAGVIDKFGFVGTSGVFGNSAAENKTASIRYTLFPS